jgi:alpha-methylacyl-CoA racemase
VHDREQLRTELRRVFASRTLDEWVACLRDVDTCFAPVNTLAETVQDPHVRATGLFTTLESGLQQISPPFAFSATPASIRVPPPELGEHTAEVLGELGLSAAELASLAERGVV